MQLSLHASLDAAIYIEIGRGLSPLRDDGVDHWQCRSRSRSASTHGSSTHVPVNSRDALLAAWDQAPEGGCSHDKSI